MGTFIVIYLLCNAALATLVAYAANQKGRDPAGFFLLSFFFSFLVGILILLVLPGREVTVQNPNSKSTAVRNGSKVVKCPYCAEWIKPEAAVCRYCAKSVAREIADILSKEREYERAFHASLERQRHEREQARIQKLKDFRTSKIFRKLVVVAVAFSLLMVAFAGWQVKTFVQLGRYTPTLTEKELPWLVDRWISALESCGFRVDNRMKSDPGWTEVAYSSPAEEDLLGDGDEFASPAVEWSVKNFSDGVVMSLGRRSSPESVACVSKDLFGSDVTKKRLLAADNRSVKLRNGYTYIAENAGHYFVYRLRS